MSVPSQFLPHNLFVGLDIDSELVGGEEDLPVVEPSVPSTLGKRHSPSGESSGEEEDGESPRGPEDEPPLGRSVSVTHPNPGSLQEEQAVQRMTKRLKLSSDDTSLIERFSQVCDGLSLGADYKRDYTGTLGLDTAGTFILQHPCSQE
jgi:hypothetical protein